MTLALCVTLIAPDIVAAIPDGSQGLELALVQVTEPAPMEWESQRMDLGEIDRSLHS
ncbi:hypothetical protein [Paracoccus sp. SCSIO 75233]|uniref:hypothetical protein n=1 Tax=Paracoccus sp. SCSIO 75233 TaxID=3017782 RepID=UPI0034A077E1